MQEDFGDDTCVVYISNISYTMNEAELHYQLRLVGGSTIQQTMMLYNERGRPHGCALCWCKKTSADQISESLNGKTFHGKQECIPVGCVPSAAVAAGRGGRCLPGWGCLLGGICSMHAGIHPPWTEWLTNGCKNITFPQLCLRTVIIGLHSCKIATRHGKKNVFYGSGN